MINNLNILFPEIFLSLSIFSILMLGVFIKKSFNLIFNLSSLIIIITLAIIFNNTSSTEKIFLDSFVRDKFSNFFKILILISSLFVLNSSKNFIIDNKLDKFEYPIIILISILGMFFMVSSNDLILFYLGLELQSLSLYILAAIDRDNLRSSEAGIKYFVLSALSSGLLLYGCSLLYGFTGSTNFEIISNELNKQNTGAIFAMVFILVGLAFKISAVPFHMWTPDVYQGSPTSITSYFAAVPKVAGLAVFIKFMYIPFSNILLEWQTIIIFISIASMILGAVAAIGQKNLKRLLAYSSIGHMGYALAGIATGAINGFKSSIVYITVYVVMNIGAFSCLYLMKKEGEYKENISDLSGISKKHPLLAMSFLIILFSLAGIPPLGGFFAKFYIFSSVLEQKMYTLAIIGLLTTVISAVYYLKIIKTIYFDENKLSFDLINNKIISGTILISCTLLITFFLYPSFLNKVVSSLFLN
ncbi:NADH-quinone oxidoreductase subunit NuoN [Pelagibacteraceae bacterium]|jgi:NADH-quinone oxidoreductase subunit N|nr:NADH-quinone oxidoreductase subunit NuoN [Pelagibacteraceae bacterium]|tara:strand:+ start:1625 stop:3040 length:1416 start_codon:yes stop_codon:yes gene_type:complete